MTTSPSVQPSQIRPPWWMVFILASVTALVFARSLQCGFTIFDDNYYVTSNSHVLQGLTLDGWKWAWTTNYAANWHPLTWLSLMLDTQIYGTGPSGFHFTNVLFHILCVVMLFRVLTLATGDVWRSFAVAAIFAVHPLRVESVTWVSERKDVLSIFLGLVACECYIRYVRSRSPWLYGSGLLLFALSLLAKPTLVSLPCVFILLDFWPLRRIALPWTRADDPSVEASPGVSATPIWWLIVEKLPWLALGVISSVMTARAQNGGGATIDMQDFGIKPRLANAMVSYIRYLGKLVWPTDLVCLYPMPRQWPVWAVAGSILLLLGASVGAWLLRKRSPWLLIGWLWYIGTLLPMIGIIQVGVQSMADRYTYFPMIGILVAAFWSIPDEWIRGDRSKIGAAGLGLAVLCLGCATYIQIGVWMNTGTLFRHALDAAPHSVQSLNNLTVYMMDSDTSDKSEALKFLQEAIELDPIGAESWNNLGVYYMHQNDPKDAAESYEKAIKLEPRSVFARSGLGVAYCDLGRFDDAQKLFEQLLRENPDSISSRHEMARVLTRKGDFDGAVIQLQEALRRAPDDPDILLDLGFLLLQVHRPTEALEPLSRYLKIRPNDALAHLQLGDALKEMGDVRSAGQWRTAIQINPNLYKAHWHLGALLISSGMVDEGLEEYSAAMKLAGKDNELRIEYASALGQAGRLDDALRELQTAIEVDPQSISAHHNLGVVLFRKNQLAQAEAQFRTVLKIQPENANAQKALKAVMDAEGATR